MLKKTITKSLILSLFFGLIIAGSAFAEYPDRPISLIVPFGTGGSTDTNARLLAMDMEKILGQRIIVKNISGAAGLTGTKAIADSKPDGYTFGYIPPAVVVMHPHIRKVAYTLADFEPVALAVSFPYTIFVRKDSPWNDFNDMITDMKAKPGHYFVGTAGVGSMPYFAIMSVLATNKIKANMVNFKVDGDAMQAMMGNRISVYTTTPAMLKTHDVKALATLSLKRDPFLTDVPAIKEFGDHNYPFVHWQAVVAPAGTPANIVQLVSSAVKKVSESDSYKNKLKNIYMSPDYKTPEETREFMESENEMYGKVTKEVMAAVKAN